MQIIGSQVSPFVRIVRIACEELGFPYELVETGSFATMSEEDATLINTNNPLMKVPILSDGDNRIIDSRIIVNYLIKKAANDVPPDFNTALDDEAENLISIIMGTADAALLCFLFGKTTDLDPNEGYLKRSMTRIQKSLAYLNDHKTLGNTFGPAEIMLISVLGWFKKREICDLSTYQNLLKICEKYENRDSIVKTRIPETA